MKSRCPSPAFAVGGVHRGEQRKEDGFLPCAHEMPRKSADPVARP